MTVPRPADFEPQVVLEQHAYLVRCFYAAIEKPGTVMCPEDVVESISSVASST